MNVGRFFHHPARRLAVASLVAATFWGTGCSNKDKRIAQAPAAPMAESRPATPPPPPAPSPAPASQSEEDWFRTATLEELQARLSDVYFDYDHAMLRADARSTIDQNARWLAMPYNTIIVEVEGHCDERGTAGYNLALGERRSRSVVEYLRSLGVAPERIRFVSYGKERPVCVDTAENCWWRNRRAHFRVASKGAGYSDE